ncbi:MAG TPA: ATP synthase F1 subunit delta [Longimicrobiales bacterium]|nr:ATP synthase F1 subunit delta [Longimicrobiales bacterium]
MRDTTISRSYAEALLELGQRSGEAEAYADAFGELDAAVSADPKVRLFLETPKIEASVKQEALRKALEGRVPETFLRFLMVVLAKHRQGLLEAIRQEYEAQLDQRADRVNAQITLARDPDEATVAEIRDRLSKMLGKTVVPHVRVNPGIVGGIIVKYGDRVLDGSIRRQLRSLRREMMHAGLPERASGG